MLDLGLSMSIVFSPKDAAKKLSSLYDVILVEKMAIQLLQSKAKAGAIICWIRFGVRCLSDPVRYIKTTSSVPPTGPTRFAFQTPKSVICMPYRANGGCAGRIKKDTAEFGKEEHIDSYAPSMDTKG